MPLLHQRRGHKAAAAAAAARKALQTYMGVNFEDTPFELKSVVSLKHQLAEGVGLGTLEGLEDVEEHMKDKVTYPQTVFRKVISSREKEI